MRFLDTASGLESLIFTMVTSHNIFDIPLVEDSEKDVATIIESDVFEDVIIALGKVISVTFLYHTMLEVVVVGLNVIEYDDH